MKKIFSLLILLACLSCMNSNAQAPQGIPYQSVIRNGSGALLINQAVHVRFSIHDSSALGTIVYQETHVTTTSAAAMLILTIGQGTAVTGNFSTINWGNGAKFMQVELDASGGNNYIDLGTQQMMSVPYALYAAHSNDAGPAGVAGATGATGLLSSGAAAGNTPYWDGSNWVTNSSNLFNNGGHVGIGTNAPASKLHIITDDASGDGLGEWGEGQAVVGKQGVHGGGLGLAYDSSNNVGTIYSLAPSLAWKNLDIRANSIRLLTEGYGQAVTTNGKVGIGTETPNAKLDVQGGNILTSGTLTAGTVTYPNSHGTSGQVLSTTGAGSLIWVTSTQGIQGLTGATGPQGSIGLTGAAGPIGLTGATGLPSGGANGQVLTIVNGVPTWATTSVPLTVGVVTTDTPSSITVGMATCGGNVSNDGGFLLTARGVCWSTSSGPTVALATKTINGNIVGSYTSSITGLNYLTTYYVRAYVTNIAGTAYGAEYTFTTTGPVVGTAYQGGIIAYILQPGDIGYDGNVPHGLIAAPSDQSTAIHWYNGSYVTTGATATALGTGNANTNTIVSVQGAGSYAAKLCYDLVLNGYSDWYLPSQDELYKLYLNQTAIGGFAVVGYWSSSEVDNSLAWLQTFINGSYNIYTKNATIHVRAVRAF